MLDVQLFRSAANHIARQHCGKQRETDLSPNRITLLTSLNSLMKRRTSFFFTVLNSHVRISRMQASASMRFAGSCTKEEVLPKGSRRPHSCMDKQSSAP